MLNASRKLVCTLALGLALAPATALAVPSLPRIQGTDRYQTMAYISQEATDGGRSKRAVLATGQDFPDALAASALAGAKSCPVILTKSNELTPEAEAELKRLHAEEVVIVGGANAVSDATKATLEAQGYKTSRVFGTTRQATSVEAFKAVRAADDTSKTAIVATGTSFADALSISPYAYATSSPIILTDAAGKLTAEAVNAIKGDKGLNRVVLVGGASVVSDDVKAQLGSGFTFVRLAGSNRYETSGKVAAWETDKDQGFDWTTPVIATGNNFPDALAGSALCGRRNAPLLLANGAADATMLTLTQHSDEVYEVITLGGTQSVDIPLAKLFEVDAITRGFATSFGSGREGLRAAYDFVATFGYVKQNVYPEGDWTLWSLDYAQEMNANGQGNCYRYASLMCWIARSMGYDARVISGMVPYSSEELEPHAWVEVREAGKVYVIDPDMHKFIPERDFFMRTYDKAPLQYYDLNQRPY